MPIEKIKRLGEQVDLILEVLNDLNARKNKLEKQMEELKKESVTTLKENKEAKRSLEKLNELKLLNLKMEKDQSTIRLKVKNVLEKVEKMNFS